MTPAPDGAVGVLLVGALALLLWPAPGRPARRLAFPAAHPPGHSFLAGRLHRRRGPTAALSAAALPLSVSRRRSLAGLAAVLVAVLGGTGLPALVAAGLTGVLVERALRRPWVPDAVAAEVRRDLPVACDLLAVCLAAGAPLATALGEVARAVPGALGSQLSDVAALSRLGADAGSAWAGVHPGTAALGRTLTRAEETGSAIVPSLHRLAADSRAAERNRVQSAIGRAGVWVLAPLGVCFLPAFLCLGVVPMVLGVAADVLG